MIIHTSDKKITNKKVGAHSLFWVGELNKKVGTREFDVICIRQKTVALLQMGLFIKSFASAFFFFFFPCA